MVKVALLCSGSTQPDKIFDEDIIVRVNKGFPRKDKRTDIWYFGAGTDYHPYLDRYNAKRVISHALYTKGDWHENYPIDLYNELKNEMGCEPTAGMCILYYLSKQYDSINIYGMDSFDTGYFYKVDEINIGITHDMVIEKKFIAELVKNNKHINQGRL